MAELGVKKTEYKMLCDPAESEGRTTPERICRGRLMAGGEPVNPPLWADAYVPDMMRRLAKRRTGNPFMITPGCGKSRYEKTYDEWIYGTNPPVYLRQRAEPPLCLAGEYFPGGEGHAKRVGGR